MMNLYFNSHANRPTILFKKNSDMTDDFFLNLPLTGSSNHGPLANMPTTYMQYQDRHSQAFGTHFLYPKDGPTMSFYFIRVLGFRTSRRDTLLTGRSLLLKCSNRRGSSNIPAGN